MKPQSLWSLSLLPEGGIGKLNWQNRDIYDIHGRLLFRDKTLRLTRPGYRIRVRTAANDELRSPVWTMSAGPDNDLDAAIASARAKAAQTRLGVIDGPEALVCYAYPKLGLMCEGRNHERVVLDLFDHTPVPVDFDKAVAALDVYCWSPLEMPPSMSRWIGILWTQNVATLSSRVENSPRAFSAALQLSRARMTEITLGDRMTLIGQMHTMACAPASFTMILRYHGSTCTQQEVANAMGTTEQYGTDPDRQAPAISLLTGGTLVGTMDMVPSLEKAREEVTVGRRPFKQGISAHARVLAGWKTDDADVPWVYVYDPWPVNQGEIYWEQWGAVDALNFVYVRPPVVR
jgi:hypothetical protein